MKRSFSAIVLLLFALTLVTAASFAAEKEIGGKIPKELVAMNKAKVEKLLEEKKFGAALALCEKMLKIDPADLTFNKLKWDVKTGALEHDNKNLQFEDKFQDRKAELEVTKLAKFPEEHVPIKRPAMKRFDLDKPGDAEKAMRKELQKPISMSLVDTDLSFVLDTLYKISGINIIADPNDISGKKVTLHIKDMPLEAILKYIAKTHDIAYTVTKDAIWITSSDKAMLEPRIYPLASGLLEPMQTGSTATATPGGGAAGGRTPRAGGGRSGATTPKALKTGPSYLEETLTWIEGLGDDEWPTGSSYLIDKKTNSLLVFTTPEAHKRVGEFLALIDRQPLQVLIQARFIELNVDDASGRGIYYEGTETDFPNKKYLDSSTDPDSVKIQPTTETRTGTLNTLMTASGGWHLDLYKVLSDAQYRLVLNYYENKSGAKILTAPQVAVINNLMANIEVVDKFQYPTRYDEIRETQQVVNNGTVTDRDVIVGYKPDGWKEERLGFFLKVKPSIGNDNESITLLIQPTINSLNDLQDLGDFTNFPIIQNIADQKIIKPLINERKLATQIVVKDGQTVVMGGLVKSNIAHTSKKIPILGDIPILGELLFTSRTKTTVRDNLLIFVTAKIITPYGGTYQKSTPPDTAAVAQATTAPTAKEKAGIQGRKVLETWFKGKKN